jgi:hypothetical protein
LPLLERVRVEFYLPDVLSFEYQHLLQFLEEELTYTFGGTTIVRGLEGSYLSEFGKRIPDRINLLYSDAPLALSTEFVSIAAYVRELISAVLEALPEEAVLISVEQVYHAV